MKAFRNNASIRAIIAATCVSAMIAALLAFPATAAEGCATPPVTFPVADLQAGMTGVGQTVIKGTTVEPFNVEILGVLPDASYLGVDIIVAEMTGPAAFLETTGGAVAGMSGSPVYVNGQLAGALASRVAENRHIFGITAAEDMIGIFDLSDPSAASMPSRVPLLREVIEVARAQGSMLTDSASLESLPIPMGVSGLGASRPLAEIEGMFAEHGMNVSAFRAGSSVPAPITIDPTHFAPGDGLGVALSYGDVSYYGIGTTTAVCGDIALGFGHPMFWGQGEVSLGMTDVNVIAIDNVDYWGRKIGTIGDTHGMLTQDRFAGVAGIFGESPTFVPITSDVSSPDTGLTRQGQSDAAWDEDWFVADVAFNHGWSNFTYVQQANGPGTVDYDFTITGTREGGSPFTVTNRWFEANDWGAASGVWRLADFLYILAGNGFEDIAFTGVDLTGTITGTVESAQISSVRLSSPLQPTLKPRSVVRAEPGSSVTVEVTLVRADGGPDEIVNLTVKVPARAQGSEAVRLSGGRGRIVWGEFASLDEILYALNGGDHLNDLVVKSFGQTRLKEKPFAIGGRATFTIQVV